MTERQREKFEFDQERLFKFMRVAYPYRRPKSRWVKANPNKILSLADPHVQFHNQVVFDHVQKHEKDAATLIVPGDLGDYYSKSRFKKVRYVSFREELQSIFYVLEWMATHWQTVKIMIGNHDNRPEKHVVGMSNNQPDILIMTEQNLLRELASSFDNIEIVGTQLDSTDIELTHVYQFGDIVFTHGELSLKANSGNLDRVEEYLNNWQHVLNLQPFRVIAQAHNHRDSVDSSRDLKRFLLPTSSNPYSLAFEYIYSSRMVGKPPAIGYSLFYQYGGETDVNESKNIVFRVRHGRTEPLPCHDAPRG